MERGGDYRNALCQSVRPFVTFRVRAITYVCIDGLPSNLVQKLSTLRRCADHNFTMHLGIPILLGTFAYHHELNRGSFHENPIVTLL